MDPGSQELICMKDRTYPGTIGRTIPYVNVMKRGVLLRLFIIFLTTVNVFVVLYAPQPILPILSRHFKITTDMASLTISTTIMMLALSSLVLAPFLDRWPRKRVILVSSLALIVPSLALSISHSFSQVLIWRTLYGVFIPGVTAIIVAYISEEFTIQQKGRVMGVYVSANVAGGLLGRVIAGPISEFFSWQTVFGVLAIYSSITAFLTWVFLPKSTKQTNRSSRNFRSNFHNKKLMGLFLIGFSQFFAFIGFFTYIPFYASGTHFHLSVSQVSLLYLTYVFGIFSAPVAGFLSDKIGRQSTMAIGHMIGGVGILLTLWPTILTLIIGSSILTLGNFASQSAATAYVTDVADGSPGSAMSLYLFFFYVGGSLGAWLPGLLWRSAGWHGLVYLTLGAIAMALLSNYFLASNTNRVPLSHYHSND